MPPRADSRKWPVRPAGTGKAPPEQKLRGRRLFYRLCLFRFRRVRLTHPARALARNIVAAYHDEAAAEPSQPQRWSCSRPAMSLTVQTFIFTPCSLQSRTFSSVSSSIGGW